MGVVIPNFAWLKDTYKTFVESILITAIKCGAHTCAAYGDDVFAGYWDGCLQGYADAEEKAVTG